MASDIQKKENAINIHFTCPFKKGDKIECKYQAPWNHSFCMFKVDYSCMSRLAAHDRMKIEMHKDQIEFQKNTLNPKGES